MLCAFPISPAFFFQHQPGHDMRHAFLPNWIRIQTEPPSLRDQEKCGSWKKSSDELSDFSFGHTRKEPQKQYWEESMASPKELPSAIAKKESNISLLLILTKASFFFEIPILELAQQTNPPALHSPSAVNRAPISLARQQNSLRAPSIAPRQKQRSKQVKTAPNPREYRDVHARAWTSQDRSTEPTKSLHCIPSCWETEQCAVPCLKTETPQVPTKPRMHLRRDSSV